MLTALTEKSLEVRPKLLAGLHWLTQSSVISRKCCLFAGGWKGAPVAIKVIRRGKGALNGNDISEEAMLGLAAVHPNIVSLATGACPT